MAKKSNEPVKAKKVKEKNKKNFLQRLNDKYFYGSYRKQSAYIGQSLTMKQYLIFFVKYFIISFICMFMIFPNIFYTVLTSLIVAVYLMNEVSMNAKKINYEYFLLCELCNYTQNMSLLLKTNNVYQSLNNVLEYVENPIRKDLEKVIEKIDDDVPINEAFQEFNEKYNYRTVTLFNQTLDLIDKQGNSESESMLYLISKELGDIRIKKDRFLKFKKEWRSQFYVVLFLCLVLPVLLKYMIADIYIEYMTAWGNYIMFAVIGLNLFIISKVEGIYRNQDIGDGGSR